MFKQTANLVADALTSLGFLDIEYREFPAFCTIEIADNGKHLGRVKVEEEGVSFIDDDGMEMSEELWSVWQIATEKVGDALRREMEWDDEQEREEIPDEGYNHLLLNLWGEGCTSTEIGERLGYSPKTILNRLSDLRRVYGEEAVPTRRGKRKKRVEMSDI